jgi:uncharacterized membrane protein
LGSDPASIAYGINNVGQIIGKSFPQPYNSERTFLNTDVTVTQLATFAGAVSINNFGTVCGTGQLAGSSNL